MNDQTAQNTLPDGEYAIVEFFGHTTMVGRITEVERFGTKMLALEACFKGALLPAVFNGGAAIYRLTPCSKEIAASKGPTETYQLPTAIRATIEPPQLEAPGPRLHRSRWDDE